jgi:hypothetical protein
MRMLLGVVLKKPQEITLIRVGKSQNGPFVRQTISSSAYRASTPYATDCPR